MGIKVKAQILKKINTPALINSCFLIGTMLIIVDLCVLYFISLFYKLGKGKNIFFDATIEKKMSLLKRSVFLFRKIVINWKNLKLKSLLFLFDLLLIFPDHFPPFFLLQSRTRRITLSNYQNLFYFWQKSFFLSLLASVKNSVSYQILNILFFEELMIFYQCEFFLKYVFYLYLVGIITVVIIFRFFIFFICKVKIKFIFFYLIRLKVKITFLGTIWILMYFLHIWSCKIFINFLC